MTRSSLWEYSINLVLWWDKVNQGQVEDAARIICNFLSEDWFDQGRPFFIWYRMELIPPAEAGALWRMNADNQLWIAISSLTEVQYYHRWAYPCHYLV